MYVIQLWLACEEEVKGKTRLQEDLLLSTGNAHCRGMI